MSTTTLEYEFLSPARIVFGWGCRRGLETLAATLGRRVFTVIGSRTLLHNGIVDALEGDLRSGGLNVERAATIDHEPVIDDVDRLAAWLRRRNAGIGDMVLALGGGSAIDLGKAGAAMATNRHGDSVRDFLEGIGRGLQLTEPPLPIVAMPTTGGTGTEATKNAVITSHDPPVKKSLRSPLMVPRLVVVDPELSVSVPPAITAWTGMDAITQLIESYICRFAKPLPRALAVEGLWYGVRAVVRAVRDGNDRPARAAMAHAALLSGMALANSGLGLAHGVAAALGVTANVAHGLACAVMLPVALRVNRQVAEHHLAALGRQTLSLEGSDAFVADAFSEHIASLCSELEVPRRLSALGVGRDQLDELTRGSRGNSMNGNPRQLSDQELRDLLEEML
jgi:alcohol dehydrogenase class IV